MVMFTYAVIKGDGIDNHEPIKIVFIRYVVAMPRNYVKGAVTLIGHK